MKRISLTGFTLIEILIGLVIFSIIAVSLYSTFFSGTSVWKKSEDINRLYQEARWSLDTIAKELRNAVAFHYGDSYPDFAVFRGNPESVSFLIASESGIKRVRYLIEKEDENQNNSVFYLKREELSLIDSLQEFETSLKIEIFSYLVAEGGLKFSYAYGSSPDEIEWRDTWEETEYVPAGVRMTLVLRNPKNVNIKTEFNKTVFIPTGVIVVEE